MLDSFWFVFFFLRDKRFFPFALSLFFSRGCWHIIWKANNQLSSAQYNVIIYTSTWKHVHQDWSYFTPTRVTLYFKCPLTNPKQQWKISGNTCGIYMNTKWIHEDYGWIQNYSSIEGILERKSCWKKELVITNVSFSSSSFILYGSIHGSHSAFLLQIPAFRGLKLAY